MASHGISWVPGAHVRFGNLYFIVMTEGELAQVPAAVQTLHSTVLDTVAEALEELQLRAPEARAPGSNQLLGFKSSNTTSWPPCGTAHAPIPYE